MPSFNQSFPVIQNDKDLNLAIAYQALLDLNWDILFASEKNIIAHTGKKLASKGQSINVVFDNDQQHVTSEMTAGELTDMFKVNKKNTNKFIDAFNTASATRSEVLEAHKESLNALKVHTLKTIEEEERDAVEMAEAMNLGSGKLYGTYALIGINVLIFILMIVDGAGLVVPESYVHIKWGSNFSPLTLSGDWWRLISSTFIHFGIIHLLMNMYCLFTIGNYLERMVGTVRFLVAYLSTGVLASVLSLWWHTDIVNSAGASGAVFGMYGLFLAMLLSKLIPKKGRQEMLKNIGIFVAFNLLYGMKSGIDNAAHVGGLISGFVIGFLYVYSLQKERHEERKLNWIMPVVLISTLFISGLYLYQNLKPEDSRQSINKELYEAGFADSDKFNEKLGEFDKVHQEIINIHDGKVENDKPHFTNIEQEGMSKLKYANDLITSTKALHISPESHAKADKLLNYISLREKEMSMMKTMLQLQDTSYYSRIIEAAAKADAAFQAALK